MIPSPADLTYFVATAESLNISRAAERLGISQPSLSLALQRLEQAVGVPLLIRTRKGVTLTQGGRQLLAHARGLLQTWDDIRSATQSAMQDIGGSYTIGCHVSVAMDTLSAFLPDMLARYPRLDIRLRHDLSRRITEDVVSMKVDIGIVVNPVQHPDLVMTRLYGDEVGFWVAAQNKRAEKDLAAGRATLVCDPDIAQAQFLLKDMKKRKIGFDRMLTSPSLEVLADMTAHGAGIGVLPAMVAARARKPLRRVAKTPVFQDEHCLIYRVENKNVSSIQALSEAIRKALRKR